MEQSSSTSQRQHLSRFTSINDRHSAEAGPSRPDITTTTNEKSTGLVNPRPWNYSSDLDSDDDYDDDYDDDRSTFRSRNTISVSSLRTSSPQQSTTRKRKAFSGIETLSKLIIHESCIAAGVSSPKLQSVKAKVELLEMQYPDDLPYIITFSRNTQTLYLEFQECKKSLSLLKGGGNIGRHASGVLHSTCVDERLRRLELEGFRRQSTKEMLARYQGFEKTLEDAVIDINVRQSTQHRLLIDEVQKKISFGFLPLDNRVTTLEKCVQESYQSVQHEELTEQRISKAWHSSESALRVVQKLEEGIKASEEKFSTGLNLVRELAEVVARIEKGIPTSSEIDRVGRLEDEMEGVKEVVKAIHQQNFLDKVNYSDKGPRNFKVSQSHSDTDRVTVLNEKVNTLTAKVCNLAGLVEKYELPTSHSSTGNDAALIEDLKKSKGTMMKRLATSEERLAALEGQNDRLMSKIKERERR
ncbi:hypothetical protein BCON_0247g00110 [Botryotinia convoluta]|uniref:Uncharacterized protein n=1 Tax=Botryotinia convoluta TaxID=54673 RepID=A0A4Z1HTS1_9HELO|nr:hypothetical protein BCON_0247g00110 [Botryotinia convoluta]